MKNLMWQCYYNQPPANYTFLGKIENLLFRIFPNFLNSFLSGFASVRRARRQEVGVDSYLFLWIESINVKDKSLPATVTTLKL